MKGLHRDLFYAFTYSVPRETSHKSVKRCLVHNFQLALLGTHCENRLGNKIDSVNITKLFLHSGLKEKYLHSMLSTEHPVATGFRDPFWK